MDNNIIRLLQFDKKNERFNVNYRLFWQIDSKCYKNTNFSSIDRYRYRLGKASILSDCLHETVSPL